MTEGSSAQRASRFAIGHWNRRGALALVLAPLALAYGGVLAVRRALFAIGIVHRRGLRVPVVVVGNFVVGGTGKTPLTIALAQALVAAGRRPGIVSRGYGGTEHGPIAVGADADPARFGDEPVLLARRSGVPVWIGRDRVAAGNALLAAHREVDVVIADDGLQHVRLARDVEIALIDARGYGNRWLLPAGPLREMPRPVDAIVRNGEGSRSTEEFAMRIEFDRCYRLSDPKQELPLEALRGARLRAVAGIGSPERFFAMLERLGLRFDAHAFPDHHRFAVGDIDASGVDYLLMTEKDAVKCARLGDRIAADRIVVVAIGATLDPALVQLVLERIGGLATA